MTINSNEFDNKYLRSCFIKNGACIGEEQEEALIYSMTYDMVNRNHENIKKISLIIGIVLTILSLMIIIGFLLIDLFIVGIIIGIILLLIGGIIILYGWVIHKPYEIDILSKLYVSSFLVPHNPSLLFDACDIEKDVDIEYSEIPLKEIVELSSQLPDPPSNIKNERKLLLNLKEKEELSRNKRNYKLQTQVVEKDSDYAKSILDILPFCINGNPNGHSISEKISIEDAIKDKDIIENLSNSNRIIEILDNERRIIAKKSQPFIDTLNNCIKGINEYMSKINESLRGRFIGSYNLQSDRKLDADYGYEFEDFKYHIKVGSSKGELHPLDMIQRVVDKMDEKVKKNASRIKNEGIRKITEARNEATQKEKDREYDFKERILSKEREAERKLERASELFQLGNEANEEAGRLQRKARGKSIQIHNSLIERSNIKIDERDGYYSKANDLNEQAETLKEDAEQLSRDMVAECERIRSDADRTINKLKESIKREVKIAREPNDELIKKRNSIIDLFVNINSETITSEERMHSYYFNQRRNSIIQVQNTLLATIKNEINGLDKLLHIIAPFNVNAAISVPTRISFPIWILKLNKKDGSDFNIIPPTALIDTKNTPKKNQIEYDNFMKPLTSSLNSLKERFKNDRFANEGKNARYSFSDHTRLAKNIDEIGKMGYIHDKYRERIVKDLMNPKKGGI